MMVFYSCVFTYHVNIEKLKERLLGLKFNYNIYNIVMFMRDTLGTIQALRVSNFQNYVQNELK